MLLPIYGIVVVMINVTTNQYKGSGSLWMQKNV